jgi:hypothetical protein
MTRLFYISLLLILVSCNFKPDSICVEGDCHNGNGTIEWTDGGFKKGHWINGELTGKGTQFYGSSTEFAGDIYIGDFKNDKRHGFGSYYDKSEDVTFTGQWVDGKMTGKGKAKWGKNSKYPNRYCEGEWKNGLMNGFGVKHWEAGKYGGDKYVGEWKNDEMNGIGTYYWKNGSYYKGSYLNGKQNGNGIYVFPSGEIFKGIWINGYCKELAQKLGYE